MLVDVRELPLLVAGSQNLSVGLGVSALEEHLKICDGCILAFVCIVTCVSNYI